MLVLLRYDILVSVTTKKRTLNRLNRLNKKETHASGVKI